MSVSESETETRSGSGSNYPLHVRVAHALGWTHIQLVGNIRYPGGGPGLDDRSWYGVPPSHHAPSITDDNVWQYLRPIPAYDEDWGVTGPIVAKIGLTLTWRGSTRVARFDDHEGTSSLSAMTTRGYPSCDLIAVCNLIIALHAAGKVIRA